MSQSIGALTLLVRDYDEAINYFVRKLGFTLVEDTHLSNVEAGKRWVRVAPPGAVETTLLLTKAATPAQVESVGCQAGGRVFLFLRTDDFFRDYEAMLARGIKFIQSPRTEAYGMVAVFEDLYGNKFDLLGPSIKP